MRNPNRAFLCGHSLKAYRAMNTTLIVALMVMMCKQGVVTLAFQPHISSIGYYKRSTASNDLLRTSPDYRRDYITTRTGGSFSQDLNSVRVQLKTISNTKLFMFNGNDEDSELLSPIKDVLNDSKAILTSVAVALLVILTSSFVVVDAGQEGVVSRLGNISELSPGPHLVVPLISNVSYFSTKTQLVDQSNFVPTKEGLTVELDTAILYRLKPDQAGNIYKSVGTEYSKTIIEPQISSTVRGLTSEVEAKALYTSGRSLIQNKLKEDLSATLEPRGIIIEDVLLKAVVLPKELKAAIEQKAKAEQEAARMQFVLSKERQEAERKAIEAQGVADFQSIVTKGISPELLKWKGIEATEKLAKSDNAKIVIIGNDQKGLPVILGKD